jgi:uncharacterized Zn-binding protein involved in type VI secretion
MGQPAAKKGDRVTAIDTHIVMVPSATGSVPTPLPHTFSAVIDGNLSSSVTIMKQPAATVDSTATNTPSHVPTPPGVSFQTPPKNSGSIITGSSSVTIQKKKAARNGDTAKTCNDPADLPVGTVVATGSVTIGG